mgnify:CR=1 FL=1
MQNLEAEFASLDGGDQEEEDCGDQEEEDCGDQEEEGDLSARLASLHLSTGPSHTHTHAHAYMHAHAYTHTQC